MELSIDCLRFSFAKTGILVLVLAFVATANAHASANGTILVTRFDDPVPAPQCQTNDCTLRGAILLANSEAGSQKIDLPAGVFDLNLSGSIDMWYEDEGQTADIDIDGDLTIVGAGVSSTILTTTSQAERALDIHNVDVRISGLTIRDLPYIFNPFDCGRAIRVVGGRLSLDHLGLIGNTMRGSGGAICAGQGDVSITDSVIASNGAGFSGNGGAILSSGTLTLTRVLLKNNYAETGDGGAISGNVVHIADSVIVGNGTAGPFRARRGGGIAAQSLSMTNVTVSGNRAALSKSEPIDGPGGGIFVWQNATLTNVTIANNQAGLQGGGLAANEGAKVTVSNSIISGNSAGGGTSSDCFGTIASGGHNIAGDATCNFNGDGDLNSTDPLLGSLLPVGDTYAHPPLVGSAAVDSADPSLCPGHDQRGVSRPQGTACDRGAYEVIAAEPGDIDCNGSRTVADVIALLAALVEVRGADCLSAGDLNLDHVVNEVDALLDLLLCQPAAAPFS